MSWAVVEEIIIDDPSLKTDEFYLDESTKEQRAVVINAFNEIIMKNTQTLNEGFKELLELKQEKENRKRRRKSKKSKKSKRRKNSDYEKDDKNDSGVSV